MAPNKQIPIVLTFDDGPHTAPSTKNHTLRINNYLANKKIAAAFFIQAQVDIRMGSETGKEIVRTLYNSGHSIQIHTGSVADHAFYYNRAGETAYDINGDKKVNDADGKNGLQSDMKYAKKAIAAAIHQAKGNPDYTVRYARAPTGALSPPKTPMEKKMAIRSQIIETLAREGLSNVGWNVDSGDNFNPRPPPEKVITNLKSDIHDCLKNKDQGYIIALFHDINDITAENISKYIDSVAVFVRECGRVPAFSSTRQAVDSVLEQHKTKE